MVDLPTELQPIGEMTVKSRNLVDIPAEQQTDMHISMNCFSISSRLLCNLQGLLLYAFLSVTQVHAVEAPGANDVVDELHTALLEAMRGDESLGYDGRYELLEPVIDELFDTPLIARVILGRHWEDLSDSQKQQFLETFTRLSIATYASRFNRYDGESFQYIGTEPLNRGRILVKTEMLQNDGDSVRFDYLMHERDETWYIISVVADGVNDLSMKRAEFASVIRSRGFDGLLRELESKIMEYAEQPAAY